ILPVGSRRLGLLNDARILSAEPTYPLHRIEVLTLIIAARDDGFGIWGGASYAASQVPGASLIGYDSGGHVWVGHHEDVVRRIGAFTRQSFTQ
ncbi:MAG TPA: hypothetical protein VM491_18320, partial [Burkholderiaceae bacterium]|nr:hypothetical protein [Burkholderiaceae bacterium]